MFKQNLAKYQKIVDTEISAFFKRKFSTRSDELLKMSYTYNSEFVLRKGKRIRPILTIFAFKAFSKEKEDVIYPISVAPELFHASSLIHDDIMDEDATRRDKASMHVLFEKYFDKKLKGISYEPEVFTSLSKRYGSSIAVMQGNILYSLAFDSVLDSSVSAKCKVTLLEVINTAFRKTNDGQMMDVTFPHQNEVSKDEYVEMVTGKTSFPISGALTIGAIVAGAKKSQINNVAEYGHHLGIAFQLKDDLLDISSTKGREIGSDIKKGNKTALVIHGLSKANKKQKKLILDVLGNNAASKKDVDSVVSLLDELGSVEYVNKEMNMHILRAKGYVQRVRMNKDAQSFFLDLADYVISRKE